MLKRKPSFFERLTGAIKIEDADDGFLDEEDDYRNEKPVQSSRKEQNGQEESAEEDGQLTVDMYETDNEIVIKSIVAGVRAEDLDISINRESVVIRGKREGEQSVRNENYFHRELYWGSFSRTILRPSEVDVELAEAIEKHGLLIIRLPKLNKDKQTKLRVKSH